MKSTTTARINPMFCLFIIYLCLLFKASIGAPPCVKTRTASTKRVLPDPACCGLLIAECEQRGLQTVEEDIMLGAPVRPRCENHTCHPNDWWFDHKAAKAYSHFGCKPTLRSRRRHMAGNMFFKSPQRQNTRSEYEETCLSCSKTKRKHDLMERWFPSW